MDRKIYLDVSFRVVVIAEEGLTTDEVMDSLDLKLTSDVDHSGVALADSYIEKFEVLDSK